MSDQLTRLRRVRVLVRLVLTQGVLVSVVANILHAEPNLISQAIAAWAPLALLLAVELISRVPVARPGRAWLRIAATGVIASIAAWVSYWHMVGVATRYGETGATPYLLPVSVDGLIVVASISLIELGTRIRDLDTTTNMASGTTPAVTPPATATTGSAPAPPPRTTTVKARPAVAIPAETAHRIAATARLTPARHNGRPAGTVAQESLL